MVVNTLFEPNIIKKIQELPRSIEEALSNNSIISLKNERGSSIPFLPGRDLEIKSSRDLPEREGFASGLGQARLLHDLASIELQAMELALRTLYEFPSAPEEFREALAQLVLSECSHLKLCLEGLADYGLQWGHWPTHLSLWQAVTKEDDLIDRVLIVHRYLEGSGLDAGSNLVRKLRGVQSAKNCFQIVDLINREEVDHVDFGSQWFRKLCKHEKQDPNTEFSLRMNRLKKQIPYRSEKINREIRLKAGFNLHEIETMEFLRNNWV